MSRKIINQGVFYIKYQDFTFSFHFTRRTLTGAFMACVFNDFSVCEWSV